MMFMYLILSTNIYASAFLSVRSHRSRSCASTGTRPPQVPSSAPRVARFSTGDDWISLTNDGAVKKRVVEAGDGAEPTAGNMIEMNYVGTLGEVDWDTNGVVECWLLSQQGLEGLSDGFRAARIDATKLMDEDFFTEAFVAETLGVANKIQIKKLVMAAKRLTKVAKEFPPGTKFDSNEDRGNGAPFTFELGKKKVIRAMELAVSSMKEGERATIVSRADYAYGAEGLRKVTGDVIVPPFASLCFDIKFLKCS